MKKPFLLFLFTAIFFVIFSQLTISSTNHKNDSNQVDDQQNLHQQLGVFAFARPDGLNFAGENVPLYSSEIWERFDNELLRNVYFQSNTLLYFKKANKFFPVIEPILEKYGVPDDFKYLAIIESGLENVVSPSGAAGFWQIMKKTAIEYGLEVNDEVDERYNLEKSTVAACNYLNDAYNQFGDWTIAAASYNMGRGGVNRRLKEQRVDNYYALYLNSETARYVFRILAIKEILKNPKKYGFFFNDKDLYKMPNYTTVEVDSSVSNLYDFAALKNINYKLLKKFNPWLRSNTLKNPSNKTYLIKIPSDSSLIFLEN
tara:strand:- start:8459 stop:9403 length:945 start_codon:yes stop_codon:yes gene_type:complete